MADGSLRVVLIQPWIIGAAAVHDALAAVGLRPRITRVDFEAALEAALSRGGIDLVIWDPQTPGLSRRMVENSMREHAVHALFLELTDLDKLGETVCAALAALRN